MNRNSLTWFSFYVFSSFSSVSSSVAVIHPVLSKPHEMNHYPPVFPACSAYEDINMEEEKPPNTFVTQVYAADPDRRTVSYSIDKESDNQVPFNINDETGVIRTTKRFDYDAPTKHRGFNLSVLAFDSSTFNKVGVCKFTVNIIDINDHAPIFYPWGDESGYIPKNLTVGTIIRKLKAIDADSGKNAVVKYSLSSKKQGDSKYFTIHEQTGHMNLSKVIDKRDRYVFMMTVKAEDMGEPRRWDTKNINFLVADG